LAYYNSISGVVDLPSAIAPNSSGGGDAVSWSFTDGVNTLNNSNSTGSFSLVIEPDGTVDGEFLVEENVPGVFISFFGSDFVGATDYTSMDGTYLEAEALTGNWSGPSIVVTSTPEPRNWLLVLFGIFVFAGRKRGQRSALHQRL
jgi:hypothetical protein